MSTDFKWKAIRTAFEAGEPWSKLEKMGPSKSTIYRRSIREKWNILNRNENRNVQIVCNKPETKQAVQQPEKKEPVATPVKEIEQAKARPDRRVYREPGHKWTEKDKAKALASYIEHGSSVMASKETGIPDSTIRKWKYNDPLWQVNVEQSHHEIRKIFESNVQAIALRMIALLLATRDAATINAANNTLKAMVQNSALLAGDPTERTEVITRDEAKRYLRQELGLGDLISERDIEAVSAGIPEGPVEA